MSLINDALRRARDAAQQIPPSPAPPPQFRPPEPEQEARRGLGLLLPIGLALVALLVLFLVWRLSAGHESVRALQTRPQPVIAAETPPPPPPVQPAPVVPAEPAPAAPPASPAAAPEPPSSASPPTPVPAVAGDIPTNRPVLVEAPPPSPPPLRLQAIVLNPTRPSALINGKTLFLGDRIGGFRLVAIDQESATLVGLNQTNILSLP